MNAVRKPAGEKPELPSDAAPEAPPTISADAAPRKAHASPVHSLQARIERAFTGPNERRTVRITTMLLVVALSTWVAALVMQAGA